jgi:hypothetical protein
MFQSAALPYVLDKQAYNAAEPGLRQALPDAGRGRGQALRAAQGARDDL